ncbi:hypothetical protein SGUI_1671 [Serinicoccus hydrothermalis]|uniref:Uncharacterized protein n=1 Tax=Serinicoccus hydrothermalis TaxID=1758689 RepID=A0A1B1NCB0_9MICO|nr:hypothetical protein SGUI_1671 [Serinicoccus hydrothermalis]
MQYGSFICGSPRQLIISSDTVGTTQHEANGRIWEKGWVDHPNTRRSTWTNKSSGASASIYSSNVIISTPGHRRFYCA